MESPDTAADDNCRNPMPDYCFENRFFAGTFSAFRMVYLWGICTGIWILSDSGGDGTENQVINGITDFEKVRFGVIPSSSFSFRSEMYAYIFFGMLLLIMWYLNHINNAKNGGKQK